MTTTPGTKGARPRARRTQAERSAATQALLLDATIQSLIDVGYANTTTTRIADLAGVSRGAQMHHYPSKAELVAAAVEHLAERRAAEMRRVAEQLPRRGGRTKAALDLAWSSYKGPLFQAALELWVAGRTDKELRAKLGAVEANLTALVYELCEDLFGEEIASSRDFRRLVALSINTMQGLALLRTFELGERQIDRMWEFTRDTLVRLFEEAAG